ncbi:hypothetical protein F5Y19DRAFT_134801 [Xylariaceae sp. FL1651]|nr:hypothetical protein F5Y19DRAFT_134801 [Xylariaceae sp. FL1651]
MSADLFAAFEDLSQRPPQQSQQNPSSTQSVSTPFSFGSPSTPLVTNQPSQKYGQSSLASSQHRLSWQTSQPLPAPNVRPASVATSTLQSIQPININVDEDDDGWGDFEVAPSAASSRASMQATTVTPIPVTVKQPAVAQNSDLQRTRVIRASTLDLITNSLVDFQDPPARSAQVTRSYGSSANVPPNTRPSSTARQPQTQRKIINTDPNVLFDADDFEGDQNGEGSGEDDDFGEFETVPSPVHPPPHLTSTVSSVTSTNTVQKASELLLELDLNEPTSTYSQTPQISSFQIGNQPFPATGSAAPSTTQKPDNARPKQISRAEQPGNGQAYSNTPNFEDDWASFDDTPKKPVKPPAKTTGTAREWDSVEPTKAAKSRNVANEKPTALRNNNTASNDDSSWDWDSVDVKTETAADAEATALPPINIPPPSVLMSAFPQLFDQANEYLYKPVNGQPPNIKNCILSDPKVRDYLKGYISLASVAARIIAGRRLRWHRDRFLSQSMSISTAGSKGMKLAGVDKTQTVREDREAADVVGIWRAQVGRLRSIVAATNSATKSGGEQLRIPEITDTMQVQTVKDVPTAIKACVICGLKRNERLVKVDYEVEDSFGEWWVEHWGHVACKRFWLRHENTLRQR